MSDSVDRVFSHALNTVNKILPGNQKPPASIRLKLYGLYKQSMEGDVEGIMERPEGNDEPAKRAREKWEAWHDQSGLSRTEAKRRYITTLVETMRKYASSSPESRELVEELEFVWDQVKSNVPSSNSSSPTQNMGIPLDLSRHAEPPPVYRGMGYNSRNSKGNLQRDSGMRAGRDMDIVSPVSKEQLDLEAGEDEDEFVDAPDSQIDEEPVGSRNIDAVISSPSRDDRESPPGGGGGDERKRKRRSTQPPSGDEKWKSTISASIIKLTAELAAVREQLEARRLFTHKLHFRILRFVKNAIWGIVKHIAIDALVLAVVLLWLRSKKDRRLEGAIRVLLGDAVAQVQKLGDRQLGKIQLPKLGSGGKKSLGGV